MVKDSMSLKTNLIFLSIILMGCLEATSTFGQGLSVINVAKNPVSLKGIVNLKEVVVLDANKDCFFGDITGVVSTSTGYYILDKSQAKTVFKFDRKGKFCFKYGNLGKGPGEYESPDWISVDEASNQLVIYDASFPKLLVYNTKSGAFIKDIPLGLRACSFSMLKDRGGYIFYTGFKFSSYPVKSPLMEKNKYYQIIITDNNGTITGLQLPYPDTFNPQNFVRGSEIFSTFGNVTSLFSDYNDTLYIVGNDRKLQPDYLIDYGNNNQQLSTKFVNNIGPLPTDFQRNNQLRASSGIFQLSRQLQTNDQLHLSGIKDMKLFSYIIDKKSLNVLDLVRNNQTFNFGIRASDDKYYYSVAVNEAFKKPGEALYNDYPEVLKNALLKAETNSNPIVLVWEIGSF
jgi:hypothetical protein